jgi:CHAD domain-containing protein
MKQNGKHSNSVEKNGLKAQHGISAVQATVQSPQTLAQIINAQLLALQTYQNAALASDSDKVEAVHKLRVTTRKLQASMDLLQIGKSAAKVGKLKKQLRNLRRKLSEVRNYDVFLILLQEEAAGRKSLHYPFEALKKELTRRRTERALLIRKPVKAVQVARIAKAVGLPLPQKMVDGGCAELPEKNDEPSFSHLVDEKMIWQHTAERLEQRLEEFIILASQASPTTRPEELHQLRIAAKRLRYLLESASEMGFDGTTTVLNWLRVLQDKIGDWHDLEAIESEIIDIVARKKFLQNNLVEASSILAAAVHLQKKKLSLVKRLFPVNVHKKLESISYRVAKDLRVASQ